MAKIRVYCGFSEAVSLDIVEKINKELSEQGYEVAERGASEENGKMISGCDLCLFIYGKDRDDILDREVRYAVGMNKNVDVLIKSGADMGLDIPVEMRRRQAVWFWTDSEELTAKAVNILQNYSQSPMYRGRMFERLVFDIFASAGWHMEAEAAEMNRNCGWDGFARRGNDYCFIEVRTYRRKFMEIGVFKQMVLRTSLIKDIHQKGLKVIVFGNLIRWERVKNLNLDEDTIILDLSNLLYLVKNNEKLKKRLFSMLDYTVDDVLPKAPDMRLLSGAEAEKDKEEVGSESGDITGEDISEATARITSYIHILREWDADRKSREYENLCTEILKELFMDDLSVWKEQKKSNDDLYRFDLICKIRDGRVNPFWRFLEEFFNTKYIIFEFKNYKEAITQKEIYTTEKYLYAKALRSVAIILSCHGADKNAEKAMRGALRENGKLIISISNEDIIHMLEAKKNNEEPSDDLYTMLDNMLMALEK